LSLTVDTAPFSLNCSSLITDYSVSYLHNKKEATQSSLICKSFSSLLELLLHKTFSLVLVGKVLGFKLSFKQMTTLRPKLATATSPASIQCHWWLNISCESSFL